MGPTPFTYFADMLATRGEEEALFRAQRGCITFKEAAIIVAEGLERFGELGVRAGDRIVCLTDDTVPLGLLLLTGGAGRFIPAAISPVFSAQYVQSLCQQSRASKIVTTPSALALTAKLAGPDRVIVNYLCGADAADASAAESQHARTWRVGGNMDFESARRVIIERAELQEPNDALLVQPTSGSTGNPKLVIRKNIAFTRYAKFVGDEVERGLGVGTRFRLLLTNALTHAFAGHMFTLALRFGAEVVVPSALDINASLAEVRTLDPEVLTMTPRILRSFVRQQVALGEAAGTPLFGPSARIVLSAGGRGDADAFRTLLAQGVEVIEFYGSSEASLVAVTPHGGWRAGHAGRPVADVELKISRQNELVVRSPGMMIGYYGDSELTDLVRDEDGFYRTGDLGRLTPDGYLEIFGRRRDLFNTPEGTNIYPERIEILLESQPWVRQAFLVGDGKPFVTAHLVIEPELLGAGDPTAGATESTPVDAERCRALYDDIGQRIAKLNHGLELLERIVGFALYVRPFPEDCYRTESAKVQRTRPKFQDTFSDAVDQLYLRLPADSVMLVPPRERRFGTRVGSLFKAAGGERQASVRPPKPVAE